MNEQTEQKGEFLIEKLHDCWNSAVSEKKSDLWSPA